MLICAENKSWKQYAQLLKICKAWVKGVLFWFYFFLFFTRNDTQTLELSFSISNRPVKLKMIIFKNMNIYMHPEIKSNGILLNTM